jgi:hypothetical protein
MPHELRIIANEMLRAGANAMPLHTPNNSARKVSSQQGIFAKGLEIAAPARIAMHVNVWSEDNLRGFHFRLFREFLAKVFERVDVPG